MTYPTAEISALVNGEFVPFTVNTGDRGADGTDLLRTYRLLWEPGLVFFDPRGVELRRLIGYRSPRLFLGDLHVALGLVDLLYQRFAAAADRLRRAAGQFGDLEESAEAIYWLGIARFRGAGRDKKVLERSWAELRERFPDSSWWERADVFDVVPTGIRQS